MKLKSAERFSVSRFSEGKVGFHNSYLLYNLLIIR